jgi:membrane protease YdiL (CAAX protease family)
MKRPASADRISQLAAVLGAACWKQVISHCTTRELSRINRALARCPKPPRLGLAALLSGVTAFLTVRRQERKAAAGLLHLDVLVLLFGILATLFLLFLALGSGALERARLAGLVEDFAQVGGAEFLLLALFSVVLRRERALRLRALLVPPERRLLPPGLRRQAFLLDIFLGTVLGLALSVVLSLVNAASGETPSVPAGWLFPVHLAAGLVAAPLFEEAFFRYWLGGAFLAEGGPAFAVLLSALAFVLAHQPADAAEFCGYLVCGIALGLLWWKRRGVLLAPVTAHAVANLVTILGSR